MQPAAVVNASEDELGAFLTLIREEYGIEDDRDDAVRRALEAAAHSSDEHWRPPDVFAVLPATIARTGTVATAEGETLSDLVDDGREQAAETVLVHTVYDALAAEGTNDKQTHTGGDP